MRKARSGLRSTEGVRDDPLDDPFVRDLKADVETETIPLLEQMDSADPSEREEACEVLEQTILLSPEEIVGKLLSHGLAEKLVSRICDSKAEIRERACSLAQALCMTGGEAVCEHLVQKDLLLPLLQLFERMKVSMVLQDAAVRRQYHAILLNVLSVLHQLCQNSAQAADTVSRHPQVGSLLDYLDPALELPLVLRRAAAQLLQDLVEDSSLVCDALRGSQRGQQLLQGWVAQTEEPLMKALCVSILLELTGDSRACALALKPLLELKLAAALMALRQNALAAAQEMAAMEKKEEEAPKEGGMEVDLPTVPPEQRGATVSPAQGVLREALERWQAAAMAQQQAVETLANLLEVSTASGEGLEAWIDQVMPLVSLIALLPVAQVDQEMGAPLLQALPELDGAVARLQGLQVRGLHCLNNALIGAEPQQLQQALSLWPTLVAALRAGVQELSGGEQDLTSEDELLDALAQCLWSLARLFGPSKTLPLEPDHVAVLCGALQAHLSPLADASLAGTLGALAPFVRSNDAVMKAVTGALLSCCDGKQVQVSVVAEALDAVVDLYSDDATHAAFAALQVGAALQTAMPIARRLCDALPAQHDDREHLEEVLANVQAFLEYKSQ